MPRQGGQGKGKPKRGDHFGRSLVKKQVQGLQGAYGTRIKDHTNMKSILDNTTLDDFIAIAEMDDEDFDVHRATAKNEIILVDTENANKRAQKYTMANFDYKQIPIPRKPHWDYNMTAEEVDRNERDSFLNWRRNISLLESIAFEREQKRITPFEKNLEVWRQLWRVCERSQYLFQVVDARNPLLYYTTDLKQYLMELSPPRIMILIVNKADLLSEKQRAAWARFFMQEGIYFIFYSAKSEQLKLDFQATKATAANKALSSAAHNNHNNMTNTNNANNTSTTNTSSTITKKATGSNVRRAKFVMDESDSDNDSSHSNNNNNKVRNTADEEHSSDDDEDKQQQQEATATATSNSNSSHEGHVSEENEESIMLASSQQGKGFEVRLWAKLLLKNWKLSFADYQRQRQELQQLQQQQQQEEVVGDSDGDNDQDSEGEGDGDEDSAEDEEDSEDSEDEGEEIVFGDNYVVKKHQKSDGPVKEISKANDKANVKAANKTSSKKRAAIVPLGYSEELLGQFSVLTRGDLLDLLQYLTNITNTSNNTANTSNNANTASKVIFGMVGYPNVGKSSVINTLLGVTKSNHGGIRVAVSSTPGKTKHFQTIVINNTSTTSNSNSNASTADSNNITLCDCPGLVFPSFMRSTADMLCAGILPIHHMKYDEAKEAANLVGQRIPQDWLESSYGMPVRRHLDVTDRQDRPPTGRELLSAYCQLKTFVTSGPGGRWDEIRGCKEILKDFTDGRLLIYAAMPPDYTHTFHRQTRHADTAEGDADHEEEAERAWKQETEKILLQYYPKFAERLATIRMQKLAVAADYTHAFTADANNDANDDANDADADAVDDDAFDEEAEGVVQGNEADAALAAEIAAFMSAAETGSVAGTDITGSNANANAMLKREHKKMKTWGKKGRKLRDRDPYADKLFDSSYLTVDDNDMFYHHNYQHVSSNNNVTRKTGGTVNVNNKLQRRQLLQQSQQQQSQSGDVVDDLSSHVLTQLENEREHLNTHKVHVKNRSLAPANKSSNLTNAMPINTRL